MLADFPLAVGQECKAIPDRDAEALTDTFRRFAAGYRKHVCRRVIGFYYFCKILKVIQHYLAPFFKYRLTVIPDDVLASLLRMKDKTLSSPYRDSKVPFLKILAVYSAPIVHHLDSPETRDDFCFSLLQFTAVIRRGIGIQNDPFHILWIRKRILTRSEE
jgi:hypothetical protein